MLSWFARGRTALFVVSATVLSACSDGSTPIDPPGGSGSPLTPAERIAAIAATEGQAEALTAAGLAGDALNAALLDWLEQQPAYDAAGIDSLTSSVWAQFRDGRLLIIANNRDPAPVSDSLIAETAAAHAAPPAIGVIAAAEATELPAVDRVRLLHSFGPDFDQVQAPIEDIGAWLEAGGYEVAAGQEGDARVETLRNVSGDGLFYLNTHGGKGRTRSGQQIYAVQSSSLVDEAKDAFPDFADDLANDRLVYMTARNGGTTLFGIADWDTRYAITYKFVERYMSFGQNSIVFLNVCHSAASHADIDSFIFAMHQKGAGVYLGWSKTVSADAGFQAVRYFVDRLLGANEYRPENPKQRPFAWPEVLEDMQTKGLASDPSGALLVARPQSNTGPGAGLLNPSIAWMWVNTASDQLTINGLFGERPAADGVVTIDDGSGPVALAIIDWTPTAITTSLPRTGAGSVGDVVVRVRTHDSNPRRLSRWTGTLSYAKRDAGTLRLGAELELDGRLDAAPFRLKPGTPPERPIPVTSSMTPSAAATYAASGTYATTSSGCTYTTSWSGSGTIPVGQQGNLLYEVMISADPDAGTIGLAPLFGAPYTDVFVAACDGGSTTTETPSFFTLDPELLEAGWVYIPTDAALRAQPGGREATVHSPFVGTATSTLVWSAITAAPAYDPTQPK